MEHDVNLLLIVGAGIVFAFIFGFLAARLHMPPLIGYLAAGIVLGPYTPGFVGDAALAAQLAEIGVILLMFGVGLHFSLDDLKAVRWVAVPGAVGQIAVATAIGTLAAMAWGWTFGAGLVFGLCLSVASTVVLLKALEQQGIVETANGRIAVGWLIVEDLAMVLALVLVPAFAGALGGGAPGAAPVSVLAALQEAGLTILKVAVFLGIMLVIGPRVLPMMLRQVARLGSRELFTIAVLAVAMGIALLAYKGFGVSFALGAFCAGMVLSNSEYSHRAAEETLPLQDTFAVLFFVSVGMLFNPMVLIEHPFLVLATILIILVGKSIIALGIVLALGYPAATATLVAAALAQIGEFSFILAALGISLNLMPTTGRDLILAGAILSILLNPLAFSSVIPITNWLLNLPGRIVGRAQREMKFLKLERALAEQRAEEEAKTQARPSLTSEEVADKFPIFGRLSQADRTELAGLFVPRRASPGERVIRRGDSATEIFFITSGEVEVSLPGGRSVALGAGEFFGEMGVLSGGARTADVTALDVTDLLTLSRADLLLFLDRHPKLTAAIGDIADVRARQNRGPAPAGT